VSIFEKRDVEKKGPCTCSGDGMFLTNRHLSWIVSLIIFLGFFTFITGYFLGQKKASEQFCHKVDQDSLADKVYSSLYAMSDTVPDREGHCGVQDEGAGIGHNEPVAAGAQQAKAAVALGMETAQAGTLVASPSAQDLGVVANPAPVASVSTERYYAKLAGFGTVQAANGFVKKLAKTGCKTIVKTCQSKTAKGRAITWHQVVTEPFSSKLALKKMVDKLAKREHLKGVRIVSC